MSNISKNSGTNVAIELTSIAVLDKAEGRGECWKFNISSQFPVISPNMENGEVTLDVDSPHRGYSIQATVRNRKLNGVARILNEKNVKVATLTFADGVASGPCTLLDNKGSIFFEGYLKNGYREGKGKEYDENGNVIFEGFYKQGKRMNIAPMKEMKGYWKEMNEKNEVISICQKDEEGRNEGICYFYSNGNIDRISEWKNGEEISDSGDCKIYDEPHRVFFEGHFSKGKREGKGKEYDENGRVVYDGLYRNGRRMNIVVVKEMKGYWKEMNERNEVISICKKNDMFENDGICYFYSNGNIDRISEWKNGKEISDSGYCRIFDEPHHVFFEGHFEHGKREGKGKEFDMNGKIVFDGFYKQGKRMNIVPFKDKRGYWKVMNDRNVIMSICEKNEKNENDGFCYFYSNGEIDKVSEWKNGEELNVLKRFEGKKMIEFVKGVKRYEGEYRDSIKYNYPREGKGEEYGTDGKSLVYEGQFWNGKRHGKGKLYRNGDVVYNGKWIMGYRLGTFVLSIIVALIAMIVILFLFSITMGIVLLAIDVVFFLVLGICFCSVLFHKKQNSKDKKAQNSVITDRKYSQFIYWTLGGIAFSIVFALISIIILLIILISEQIAYNNLLKQCLGSSSEESLVITSNRCNDAQYTSFIPASGLESIEIGDRCFENVGTFNIDGLNELKSLKIGKNSFTKSKSDFRNDSSRSFHLLNCDKLESIEIGRFSFSDYAGEFELKNLPKLSTIKIGEIESGSFNFYYSSFVIESVLIVDFNE